MNLENKSLRYNTGKPRYTLLNFEALEPITRVLEYGEHKYSIFEDAEGNKITGAKVSKEEVQEKGLKLVSSGRDNWKIDLNPTEILDSLTRHLGAIIDGQELDKESNLPHIGHLGCNYLFYVYHYYIKNKQNGLQTSN